MNALYVLFMVSLFLPIYTYFIYPCILRLLKGKEYKKQEMEPAVSVVVVGKNATEKVKNIRQCKYSDIEIIVGDYASKAKGEIIVFTDTKTKLDLEAIREIVKPFAEKQVGCVVGQQTNPGGNSAFWKYENLVKSLESRIGCVSGANKSLFAVRKADMPEIHEKVLNKPFYIAAKIMENGKDIVFQDSAKTYESESGGTNFRKHVEDAVGYWQALRLFPKMLFPRHGSFVYVSHRVMKWFVWLNMVLLMVISGVLAVFGSLPMTVLFAFQVFVYVVVIVLGRKDIGGVVGLMISIGYYFVMLNAAYFVGVFCKERAN
ncbi:hypothetical protein IMSAGC012_01254 [Lachnospiraceae bacterium]|jgi:hypothetical protein|nr:hypothetical protein IMSAGC012_01254 [Lachnospiraceae bacterium]